MLVIVLSLFAIVGVTVPFVLFSGNGALKSESGRYIFSFFIGVAIASFVSLVAISSVQIIETGKRPNVELSNTQLKALEGRYQIIDKKVYDNNEKAYYEGNADVLVSDYDTDSGKVKQPVIMLSQVRLAHFNFWGNPFKPTYENAIQIHNVVIPRDKTASKKAPLIVEVFND